MKFLFDYYESQQKIYQKKKQIFLYIILLIFIFLFGMLIGSVIETNEISFKRTDSSTQLVVTKLYCEKK